MNHLLLKISGDFCEIYHIYSNSFYNILSAYRYLFDAVKLNIKFHHVSDKPIIHFSTSAQQPELSKGKISLVNICGFFTVHISD